MGGAQTTASLIDAGLVDELHLIVYPLVAGEGKALFTAAVQRRGFDLRTVRQMDGGRVGLVYGTSARPNSARTGGTAASG
jgi:dihydrofolate reductase